ncbi:MAG: aminotransferase class III-fold pyridoxal phosphate-dependent enzyme [Acidiferrobacterales bacterium]|nr:aminotransferase class III-fold pyridoxal phosphate-dependent enzyme [Acidiferrobacterales bacterium]
MAKTATQDTLHYSELDSALSDARERYQRKRPLSAQAFAESHRYMPGGNTRTVLFHTPYPLRIVSGDGCKVTDADGHHYINLLGEYTAGLFGHTNPVIREAIDRALDRGINLSGHNPDEIALAKLVCERFPSISKVRFTNSGTEANLMAISTARFHTKRNKVLVFNGGYHGGLLYFGNGGIPINAPFDYLLATYNDAASARQIIHQHAKDLACVLVEPMQGSAGCIPGTHEFLSSLRAGCDESDAILIFDEVMTSRLAKGGAQEVMNITPDMTTLGKYIGGGMSFGAFGGSDELMSIYDPRSLNAIPHAGTFNNNTLTMAAGVAAMGTVLTEQNLATLNQLGDRLRSKLNTLCAQHDAEIQVTGTGSLLGIHATRTPISDVSSLKDRDDRILELLFLDLLEAGFYIARRGFIALMLSISGKDTENFCDAFDQILDNRAQLFKKI